jgi:hypothetical protein
VAQIIERNDQRPPSQETGGRMFDPRNPLEEEREFAFHPACQARASLCAICTRAGYN